MMWHHAKSTHKTLVLPPACLVLIIIIVICSSVRVFCLLLLAVVLLLLVLLHSLQVRQFVSNLDDSPCKVSVKDLNEGY